MMDRQTVTVRLVDWYQDQRYRLEARLGNFQDNKRRLKGAKSWTLCLLFSRNPRLCKKCQILNRPELLFGYFGHKKTYTSEPILLENILRNDHCVVCREVGSAVSEKLRISDCDADRISNIWVLPGFAYPLPKKYYMEDGKAAILTALKSGQKAKCILHIDIREGADAHFWYPEPSYLSICPSLLLQLSLSYKKHPSQLIHIETWDTPFFDTNMVRNWISNCKASHEGKITPVDTTIPPGFRLIDIEEMRIVRTQDPPPFVALSYVWSHGSEKNLQLRQRNVELLEKPGGLNLGQVSDVIADAVRLCKDIGERHLWVDALCILQDDIASKHVQIDGMDAIYGRASWTLVAAIDSTHAHGLPGVRGNPRKSIIDNDQRLIDICENRIVVNYYTTINESAWSSRGWTFQEHLLSSRCLYITNYQVYFRCPNGVLQEELDGNCLCDQAQHDYSRKLPWVADIQSTYAYTELVSEYTRRNLTFSTDILDAFAGVTNILTTQLGTRFLFGVPERYLSSQLLWTNDGTTAIRPGVRDLYDPIPSWSWAAWSGSVDFRTGTYEDKIGWLVQFHFQDPHKGLRPLDVEKNWFSFERKIGEDSLFQADGGFESSIPHVKDSISIFKACPHNPWETLRRQDLEPEACELAQCYPGCLVFNTTTSSLYLREQLDEEAGETRAYATGWVSLDICDDSGTPIGKIRSERTWIHEKIDIDERQDLIVIAAGEVYGFGDPFWALWVMLVCREGGVFRRLGVGWVKTELWGSVQPRWETVVLC